MPKLKGVPFVEADPIIREFIRDRATKQAAVKRLGVARTTLNRWVERMGLTWPDPAPPEQDDPPASVTPEGSVAQQGERLPRKQEVAGSMPAGSTTPQTRGERLKAAVEEALISAADPALNPAQRKAAMQVVRETVRARDELRESSARASDPVMAGMRSDVDRLRAFPPVCPACGKEISR